MAVKKGGLGRGLDALFAENAVEEQGKAVSLRISDIEPNREQPRKVFDETALSDLAESIFSSITPRCGAIFSRFARFPPRNGKPFSISTSSARYIAPKRYCRI